MYKDNKLLVNILEDKYRQFRKFYSIVSTDFLDSTEASAAASFVRTHSAEGVLFYGGYEDAERRQVIFVPDYIPVAGEEDIIRYFRENPDDCPMVILNAEIRQKGASLRHSDYLGSLMALGIKREKIGDIIVSEKGAQIFVCREIAPYMAENYFKAGNVSLTAKILPVSQQIIAKADIKKLKSVIPSPRLDNIAAAAFDISRKAATEAISRGLVFVDNIETKKPDHFLKGGEKIVLRGKGKVIFIGLCGTSHKGKLYAEIDRYI